MAIQIWERKPIAKCPGSTLPGAGFKPSSQRLSGPVPRATEHRASHFWVANDWEGGRVARQSGKTDPQTGKSEIGPEKRNAKKGRRGGNEGRKMGGRKIILFPFFCPHFSAFSHLSHASAPILLPMSIRSRMA